MTLKQTGCLAFAAGTLMWSYAWGAAPSKESVEPSTSSVPVPIQFVTHHQTTINGVKIAFTATAGETYLYDDRGNPTGSIFSYAFIKDGAGTKRPVMFATGGGPGAASYSLNIGLLGPWTVLPERLAIHDGRAPSSVPPFDLSENHNSLLDAVDLVFIDPIGTGYSRAIGKGKNEDFWSMDDDLDSLAQFMQLWLSKNGRWDSPKFFLGESYGGTRAALLPNILMGGPGYPGYLRAITLNGVVIMSNGLGFKIGDEGLSAEWLAATTLPNYAAAAWYHNKIDRRGRSLEQFYDEATNFALSEYVVALQKENAKVLPPEERRAVVAKAVAYSGLPETAFDHSLAVPSADFSKQLLADKGLASSNYDSRYTYPVANSGEDFVADDGSLGRTFPIFVGAEMDEEHSKLDIRMSYPYAAIHWRDLLPHWTYTHKPSWLDNSPGGESFPSKHFATNADELAVAMNRNDSLYAMIVTGYYDLNAGPAQVKYTVKRAGIPTERLIIERVESGHEPYVDAGVTRLQNDIRVMVRKASP